MEIEETHPVTNTISTQTKKPQLIDKGIGNTVKTKSRKTQYRSEHYCTEKTSLEPEKTERLKVKISRKKTREHLVNTDITFSPFDNVQFYRITEESDVSEAETENEKNDKLDESYRVESENSHDDDDDLNTSIEELDIPVQNSPELDTKFIVFLSCLLPLLKICTLCFKPAKIIKFVLKGSALQITRICQEGHNTIWRSQPNLKGGTASGNLLFAASVLYSGNTFTRIKEYMEIAKVAFFSEKLYTKIQKSVLFPAVNKVYKIYRNDILQESGDNLNLLGDARCDSPGYNAKYGTYTLIDSCTNKILDFEVIQVSTAGNSSRMEKAGLVKLLNKFSNIGLIISSLTTDRHSQVRCYMKKEKPDINHQFDIWHVSKSIKTKLSDKAKKAGCRELKTWLKAILNHFWWSCASCKGNVVELKEKWLSILYHITNRHELEHNVYFKKCDHPDLSKREQKKRKWLELGTQPYLALEKIVTNKDLLNDLKYLTDFNHTGNLEVYHALLNKFCPKRLHFSMYGMIARTQLAVLDHNCGTNVGQAKTKDNKLKFKQSYSKVTKTWCLKSVAEKKVRHYIYDLLAETIKIKTLRVNAPLPNIPQLPQNIAPVEKPDKETAIKSRITRFAVE